MNIYKSEVYQTGIHRLTEVELPWERMHKKSMLIAGATGLIGRCMIDLVMEKNRAEGLDCHIYAVSRSERTARKRLKDDYFHSPFFTFIEHDVQDPLELTDISHVDYVLHLASNTHPVAYATDPVNTILTNIYGTKNLLDFSVRYEIERFVLLSSVEVYGENRGDIDRFTEKYAGYLDCNTLRAGYPESKRCAEALCQAYRSQNGLDIVIPRLPRVYGPTMLMEDSKAIAQFIKRAVSGENIILKSEGNQHYSFLHVLDAVSGILTVMLRGTAGEAYNIADQKNDATLKEAAETAASFVERRVIYHVPDDEERRGYSMATKACLDGTKVRKLGWRPMFQMKDGIQNTIAALSDLADWQTEQRG